MLPLFRSEFCVQHEIGHPDDTVHRRPDLVTHIHRELVLCPVCGLGGAFRPLQLGLRPLAVRDVLHDAQDPDRIAAGVTVDAPLRADPMQRHVWPADLTLQKERASSEGILEGLVNRGQCLGFDTREEVLGTPFPLKRAVAEYLVVHE